MTTAQLVQDLRLVASRRSRSPAWQLPVTLMALLALLAASISWAVAIGPADIAPGDVWRVVLHHLGMGSATLPPLRDGIVWQLRLPRVLTAAAVGAGLAVSGAVMQTLVRNPLADPYLLGTSSGASLGAVAVLVLGLRVALPVAAFAGALVALVAVLLLASQGGRLAPARTVLAGVAIAQLCSAVTSSVIIWSATGDSYRTVLTWLMGSLAGARWSDVAVAVCVLAACTAVVLGHARTLDAFAFGDSAAAGLGISVERTRWLLMAVVALLTGTMVAVSGAIGFVGLILPHAARLALGAGHRRLLPVAALAGAVFLVWADTLARTVFDPRELPVGVVTALVGVPAFAVVLRRRGLSA